MFRREMGLKRGSLPPKEGDLTCMLATLEAQSKEQASLLVLTLQPV